MTDNPRDAAAALDRAQQRLSKLLLDEHRDVAAIIEAGDLVARLERRTLGAERDRTTLGVPLFRKRST